MTLVELKARLLAGLKYDESTTPELSSMSEFDATQRQAKGWLGEEGLARIADRRGEIVLDVGHVEDVNKGGPDLVTLAEGTDGEMKVRFYDNKSYSSDRNISEVTALERTFEVNLKAYADDWSKLAKDNRPQVERDLFKEAAEALERGRYERVVTNWGGFSEGITQRLVEKGVLFETLRLPERSRRQIIENSSPAEDVVVLTTAAQDEMADSPFALKANSNDEPANGLPLDVEMDRAVSPFSMPTSGADSASNPWSKGAVASPFSQSLGPAINAVAEGGVGTALGLPPSLRL